MEGHRFRTIHRGYLNLTSQSVRSRNIMKIAAMIITEKQGEGARNNGTGGERGKERGRRKRERERERERERQTDRQTDRKREIDR